MGCTKGPYLDLLHATPIDVDAATFTHVFSATLQLARRHGLSSYDASYLELALRTALPLATFDKDLRSAADKAGVKHFRPTYVAL